MIIAPQQNFGFYSQYRPLQPDINKNYTAVITHDYKTWRADWATDGNEVLHTVTSWPEEDSTIIDGEQVITKGKLSPAEASQIALANNAPQAVIKFLNALA